MLNTSTNEWFLARKEFTSKVAEAVRASLSQVLPTLIPGIKVSGAEARIGDFNGEKGDSIVISLTKNPGVWYDYKSKESGDIFSLIKNVTELDSFPKVVDYAASLVGHQPFDPSQNPPVHVISTPKAPAKNYSKDRAADRAAKRANRIWNSALPCNVGDSEYLSRKQVLPYNLRISSPNSGFYPGTLLIPITNAQGELRSLQSISADGSKRYLYEGRIGGNFFIIGDATTSAEFYLCEGYATGATIHEATGQCVYVAFSAGNLPKVAAQLEHKSLIVCADDDIKTFEEHKKNPGIESATQAALIANGLVAVPQFPDPRNKELSDYNDLFIHHGLDVVRSSLASAVKPIPPKPIPKYEVSIEKNTIPLVEARENIGKEVMQAFEEPGVYLHIGDPGSGKSNALTKIPVSPAFMGVQKGEQVTIAVPTLELADQMAGTLNASNANSAMVIRGRTALHPSGEYMCKRWQLVEKLQQNGFANEISTSVCYRPKNETKAIPELKCPHSDECLWVQQKRDMYRHQFHVTTHAALTVPFSGLWRNSRMLVIDENILSSIIYHWNPHGKLYEKLLSYSAWQQVLDCLKANKPLSELENKEVLIKQLKLILEDEIAAVQSNPNMSDLELQSSLEQLPVRTLPSGLYGATKCAVAMIKGEIINSLWVDNKGNLRGAWKKPLNVESKHILALDGTGDALVWQALLGSDLKILGSKVSPNDHNIEIYQSVSDTFAQSSWQNKDREPGCDDDGVTLKPSMFGKILLASKLAGDAPVIAQKSLLNQLPEPLQGAHFNALRGLNKLQNAPGLVIVGRLLPHAQAMENNARALWPNEKLDLSGQYVRTDAIVAEQKTKVWQHANPKVNCLLRQVCEGELLQALARIRPFASGAKRKVIVLGNIPLPGLKTAPIPGENIPIEMLRIIGKLRQCEVIPTSTRTLELFGLNRDVIKTIQNYAVPRLDNIFFSSKEGTALFSPRLMSYRVEGSRGKPSNCLVFGTVEQAKAELEKIHNASVKILENNNQVEMAKVSNQPKIEQPLPSLVAVPLTMDLPAVPIVLSTDLPVLPLPTLSAVPMVLSTELQKPCGNCRFNYVTNKRTNAHECNLLNRRLDEGSRSCEYFVDRSTSNTFYPRLLIETRRKILQEINS